MIFELGGKYEFGNSPEAARKTWTPGHIVRLLNKNLPVDKFVGDDPQSKLTWLLRVFVDQWIDSGRNVDGVDEPRSRNVYWRGLGHVGLTGNLGNVLADWNYEHLDGIRILPNGKRTVGMAGSQSGRARTLEEAYAEHKAFYDPQPENEHEAREIAIYWLQELLESPSSYRIARCDNTECGRYYLRRRAPRGTIKRGTYCERCATVASSVRVGTSRKQRKQKIIECAAGVWEAFKPSRRNPRKPDSDWVAIRVNQKSQTIITGKWVTQNRKAIEAEVERRKRNGSI